MKTMLKEAAILFAITLSAGLILGFVYEITKEPIAIQKEKAKMEAYQEVFETAEAFHEIAEGEVEALDTSGNLLGYVYTITSKEGYGGEITFTMGVQLDGTVNGMSILSISETPGLGMQAEDVLKPQFANKKVEKFEYTKTGAMSDSQIDAISGATITTNAIVNGVNEGLARFRERVEGGMIHE